MTKKLRTIALASMTLFALVSAQAALVSTTTGSDFEDLAKSALGTGSPLPLTNQVQHLSFTGATVWHETQTTKPPYPTGPDPIKGYEPDPTKCEDPDFSECNDGFVLNRDSNGNLVQILQFSLDPLEPGYFKSVSLLLYSANNKVQITAYDAAGKPKNLDWDFSTNNVWFSQNWNQDMLGPNASRIEFRIDGYIAIDNLKIEAEVAGGGGTAPEPASLGLVALAMGAAAAAGRRRRVS